MPELVSPGSCPEMIAAAVHNGADAVYMGFGVLGAEGDRRGMTVTEFSKSAEFCRVSGVKVYALMNNSPGDGHFDKLYDKAMFYNRVGADAIIANDLGVIRFLHQILPDMPIIGDAKLGIHDRMGVKLCSAMGLKRIVLPTELTAQEMSELAKQKAVELEVTIHGPLCMGFPGQCRMDAIFGSDQERLSGRCSESCKSNIVSDGKLTDSPLGLKDVCLIRRLEELDSMAISAFRISGYGRDPEYVAMVTGLYSRAIREGQDPTYEEMAVLQEAYCKTGFTEGFYTNDRGMGARMLGGGGDGPKANPKFFADMRRYYINNEYQRVPLKFAARIEADKPIQLAATDDRDNTAVTEGDIPRQAFHRELTHTTLQTELFKLGGTPFYCDGVQSDIDAGLTVTSESIGRLVKTLTDEIKRKRTVNVPFEERPYPAIMQMPNPADPPILTVSVANASQLTKLTSVPAVIYIPAKQILQQGKIIEQYLYDPKTEIVAALPRVMRNKDIMSWQIELEDLRKIGIHCVQAESLSQIIWARQMGFKVRGGFGIGVYNSRTLGLLKSFGLESALLPWELSFSEIDGMAKAIPVELLAFGRVPIMMTESCVVKNRLGVCGCDNFSGLIDKNGLTYPVVKEPDCGNIIYDNKKLFWADKSRHYSQIGLWGVRLGFTTENPVECAAIVQRYLNEGDYRPLSATRGLYYGSREQ